MKFCKKADLDKTTLAVIIILLIVAVALLFFYRQTSEVIGYWLGKIVGAT